MINKSYDSGVGSLMYGMVCSRPDLAYDMSVASRFMANPLIEHWEALKWILRYLKGAVDIGLRFEKKTNYESAVVGFVDAHFAGNTDNQKSLTRYIFTLYGTAITWKSSLQYVVALSTTKAEYIALIEAMKEVVFHERTKHIDVKMQFIRDMLTRGEVGLEKIATEENPADALTKYLPFAKFKYCMDLVKAVKPSKNY
ncbi:secreted RxLR effector protein 161-like [Henckelia pumila]|uniref:secreted RxLR effector protein 161-like n=1 Tax=Henckelia pumila TaxID=405737 RepID=UPI003C6E3AE2